MADVLPRHQEVLMRIVCWGTYDIGKPRVRILLRGLQANNIEVIECHKEVWGGINDKSQIAGFFAKLRFAVKWLASYPSLILTYMRLPKHDAVIVSYLGHLDVLVLWPFARIRGVPIVWDAFLSLYNTVVEDRRIVAPIHPLAWFLYAWEWLACRAAKVVVLDTRAHADYFARRYHLPSEKTDAVFVGVEPEAFPRQASSPRKPGDAITVLFYGQFIPLHGIETIILAARKLKDVDVKWVIIGQGQDASRIREMLNQFPLPKLQWIPWVEYEKLIEWIKSADVCLGIFADSQKAGMVIPNKVFQIVASNKPVITRDSAAIRELLKPSPYGVHLIPPDDPSALAGAVQDFMDKPRTSDQAPPYQEVVPAISPKALGHHWLRILKRC